MQGGCRVQAYLRSGEEHHAAELVVWVGEPHDARLEVGALIPARWGVKRGVSRGVRRRRPQEAEEEV